MAGKGGARIGAGRKPKADEDRIRTLSINSLAKVFGSEEEAFNHIANEAKVSFPHLKLLIEYGYGKPTETVDASVVAEVIWSEQKNYVKP